jgi:hypothetical protein
MPLVTVNTATNITYTLSIKQLNSTTWNEITNIVTHVHWKMTAEDADGCIISSNGTVPYQVGTVHIKDPSGKHDSVMESDFDPDNYTPYDELTEDLVLSWIANNEVMAEVRDALADRLKVVHSHPTQDVPWANT